MSTVFLVSLSILALVALAFSQYYLVLAVAVIIAVWLLFKRKAISKNVCIIIIALLVLFTPVISVPKDGSGSYSLNAVMYKYEKVYNPNIPKEQQEPTVTFKFFPSNFFK